MSNNQKEIKTPSPTNVSKDKPSTERSNLLLSFNGWPRMSRKKLRKLMLLMKLLDPTEMGYQKQLNLLVVCRAERKQRKSC